MLLDSPEDCRSMAELRRQIDEIDQALVALLATRSTYIDRAIAIKQAEGLPARIDDRIEDVVAKVKARAARSGLDEALVEELWRRLIEWSIAREAKVLEAAPTPAPEGRAGPVG